MQLKLKVFYYFVHQMEYFNALSAATHLHYSTVYRNTMEVFSEMNKKNL